MNIPDSATLRNAITLTTKIESLQMQLRQLLRIDSFQNNAEINSPNTGSAPEPRRRGRPSKNAPSLNTIKRATEKAASFSKTAGSRQSSLKGKPRATSPSGPLGAAVLKVLEEHARPMKVGEIFEALAKKNYLWTAKKPLQTLYIRIPKLQGIIRVDSGKYALSGIPVIPAKRGRKAKNSLPPPDQAPSTTQAV
ncbi:MAG: hypothetical protein ACH346_01685 [Chthoniobacterales bacterium]